MNVILKNKSLFKNRKSIHSSNTERTSFCRTKVCSRIESLFKKPRMNVIMKNRKSTRKLKKTRTHSKNQKIWSSVELSALLLHS